MAKLTVIHLSDIHAHDKDNKHLHRWNDISKACYQYIRNSEETILAITGDIAFSGNEKEYQVIFDSFLSPLLMDIERETQKKPYVAMIPGNHDCKLIPKDIVRETLIEAISEDPEKANDEKMIEACAEAQSEFFNFSQKILSPEPEHHSKLYWQQCLKVGEKTVRISSLNAAWMSRIPETQGQLVYPIARFEEQLSAPSCIHLALIHHPFNWYAQSDYQNLRKRLRLSCTAILSGHEHLGNAGKIEEQISGSSLFFEAASLQPHEQGVDAGFSILSFDLNKKEVSSQNFIITSKDVQPSGDVLEQAWRDEELIHSALDITPEFLSILSDPGGNFTHSAKERLTSEDLFVWPDIKDWENDDISKQKTKCSQQLTKAITGNGRIIIYGDEKSGKTTLLHRYYKELISTGFAPVYISASESNFSTPDGPEKRINRSIERQYKNPQAVKNLPKEKRILLIDDFDRIKSGIHSLPALLNYADRNFSGICMTAASGFEVTNLASNEATNALSNYHSYDLMRFGLKLRYQLIKKWCALSPTTTKAELDRRADEVESIVNSVIGKQLVPEQPIYLLILLQSSEQHRHGEIQNSGLSFYYQYLITKSLGEVGVKPKELDEHFNYLSMLAWAFQEKDVKELEKTELDLFNKEFSQRFFTVDLSDRLNLLTKSRLLTKRGDHYSFSYPYIYYFFVGRYLSKNLDSPNIKHWVEDSCKKLYLRDRAHAIMFLTHHVENKWVIELICSVLRECFSEKLPIELNGDTAFINELVEKSSQLTLSPPDVEKNQNEVREFGDSLSEKDSEDIDPNEFDALGIAAKWNLLHKTAEILGQILKNYYGSLERPQKQEMIKEVFDGPLRALRLLLEEISGDIQSFVSEVKLIEQASNKNLSPEDAEKRVKRKLFNVFGWLATGVIASAGNFIASEKLREDIRTVVEQNPTNSFRLIETASRLLKPGTLPIEQIRKLAYDLEQNPYAFGVLQSLGFYHMYMFHTDEPQKQALCSALKISFEKAKAIEINKSTKLLR